MAILLFVISLTALLTGHIIRAYRWKNIFLLNADITLKNCVFALAFGYFCNFLLPLRLGEIIRAVILSKTERINFLQCLASVITERLLDFIVISTCLMGLWLGLGYQNSAAILSGTIISFALITLFVFFKNKSFLLRRSIFWCTQIFNVQIKNIILLFFFALYSNIKMVFVNHSNRLNLFVMTTLMWVCYGISVIFFVKFINLKNPVIDLFDFFSKQYALISRYDSYLPLANFDADFTLFYLALHIAPIIIILLAMYFARMTKISFSMSMVQDFQPQDKNLNLAYAKTEDLYEFLHYFFTEKNVKDQFEICKLNSQLSILQDLSAGSNAKTLLVKGNEAFFIRKYVLGADKEKLRRQAEWVTQHQNLSVTDIIKQHSSSSYFAYDMTYPSGCLPLFNFIHSNNLSASWTILQKCLKDLHQNLYAKTQNPASRATIDKYITDKLQKNLAFIAQHSPIYKTHLNKAKININGKTCHNYIKDSAPLLDFIQTLLTQKPEQTTVHGDITIENIITLPNQKYYLIDPNPDNIFNHYFLDYAKLFQSLHKGYEFVAITTAPHIHQANIQFNNIISNQYKELFTKLQQFCITSLGKDALAYIKAHEIIHYARLMPYKIQKKSDQQMIYAALLIELAHEYMEDYASKT